MSSKYKEKWRFQFPKNASYEKPSGGTPDIYKDLKSNQSSFFYNSEYTQIFIAAMALGYIKKDKKPLSIKSQSIPTSVFTPHEKWMIISLGIAENRDLMFLHNESDILSIAEQYANGGIKYLYHIYQEGIQTDPIENFEKELRKQLDRIS